MEAVLAIWSTVFLEKGAALEGSEALSADEVINVPFAIKSSDTTSSDRLITVGTARTKQLLVARLAVRNTVLLVEVAGSKRGLAVSAHEVLRVEGHVKGIDDLSKDWLMAMSAVSSRCGSA